MNEQSDEQRNYFRIFANIEVEVVPVSEEDVKQRQCESFFRTSVGFRLAKELYALDQENTHILRIISDRDREVAAYLKMLNKKIDLLGQAMAEHSEIASQNLQENVSLSEGGVAFDAKEQCGKNTYVALKITMLPSYIGVMMFGRVVESKANESNDYYRTSVSFLSVSEHERHILARHIMQVQSAQQRLRNQLSDQT